MHIETKDIRLPDGRTVTVDKRIYPMLMEWDWTYDRTSGQAVRYDGDRVHTMYAEQIRLLRKDKLKPTLPRTAVRAYFGHLPEYRALLLLSMRQREFVLFQLNSFLPGVQDVIGDTLAMSLTAYWLWKENGERVVPTELPGPLPTEPIGDLTYDTLGDFMAGELCGRWERDPTATLGVVPQTWRNWITTEAQRRWRRLYRDANPMQTAKVRTVETLLKGEDMPVWLLVQHAVNCIEHFPLA